MIWEGDYLKLSSGRVMYANRSIVGIDQEGTEPHGGSDGALVPYTGPELTPEEKRELALAMIERWAKFGGLGAGQNSRLGQLLDGHTAGRDAEYDWGAPPTKKDD